MADYKEQGNAKFAEGDYVAAEALYSLAIQSDPKNAVLYSNRSAAKLRLSELSEALQDAETAIKLRNDWDKGYIRKGAVLEAQELYLESLEAYKQGLDANPYNEELIQKVKSLRSGKAKAAKPKTAGAKSGFNFASSLNGAQGDGSSGARLPSASSWAAGLTAKQQAEWLVDCYRMRVDDDYTWGGDCRGLYGGSDTDVLEDFLVFCKLAVRNAVVPHNWDWRAFLRVAVNLLKFAFEKSDAQEKYGSEHIFSAVTGGRSLRFTAESVYGYGCQGFDDSTPEAEAVMELQDQINDCWEVLISKGGRHSNGIFDDVGGFDVWAQYKKLPYIHEQW